MEDHPRTCKWLITMVIVSSLCRVIPLPNGRTPWLINRGYLLTTYIHWDDPPSRETHAIHWVCWTAEPPRCCFRRVCFFQNPRISAWVFCTIVAINAGLLLKLGLMAYGWSTFHFHDYGRKGRFPKNSTRNLQGGPRSNRYKSRVTWGPSTWPKITGYLGWNNPTYKLYNSMYNWL